MTVREILNSDKIKDMGVEYISGYDITDGATLRIMPISDKDALINRFGNGKVIEQYVVMSQYRPPLLILNFEIE